MLKLEQNQNEASAHRKPRASTTINRKMVARPVADRTMLTKKSEIVIRRAETQQEKPTRAATMVQASQKAQQKPVAQATQTRPTAQELKATAIEKALSTTMKQESPVVKEKTHFHFGLKRVLLALVCSAVAVFTIVYFVNLNAPNISLRVAAMQTGIEASYPAYVPRDYSLSDITSENGKITLNFKNTEANAAFSLVEEKSSWDTNALLNNFVRNEYGDDYTVIREQGLTIYINNSNATWVNGGIVYKLSAEGNTLTKKQIKSIAVSL